MTEKRLDRCETCRWWEHAEADEGFCRRSTPFPTPVALVKSEKCDPLTAAWPLTTRQDWCGEWRARAEKFAGGPSLSGLV